MNSSAKGDADRLSGRAVRGRTACVRSRQSRAATGGLAGRSRAGAGGCDRRPVRPISPRQNHSARHRGSLALSVRSDARRRRARAPAARMRAGAASGRTDRKHLPRGVGRGRRGRCDAAAPAHEIGSGAADRAVRHRRRLAGDAGDRGADRTRGRLGAGGAALCAAAGSRARAAVAAEPRCVPRTTAA